MDSSREQWNDRENDRAHSELSKRVDDLGIELNIVRRLPQAVAKVDERTEALETDALRLQRAVEIADAREERRIHDLRAYVDKRLDGRPTRPSWSEIIKTVVVPVVVPVIVALIGGYFVMRAALAGVG